MMSRNTTFPSEMCGRLLLLGLVYLNPFSFAGFAEQVVEGLYGFVLLQYLAVALVLTLFLAGLESKGMGNLVIDARG